MCFSFSLWCVSFVCLVFLISVLLFLLVVCIVSLCVYCDSLQILIKNALGKGFQVTVAIWSPFANSDLTYKENLGSPFTRSPWRPNDANSDLIRPDRVAMRSPWRPPNANGDHMHNQKILHGRHFVAMATERYKWRHRAFKQ